MKKVSIVGPPGAGKSTFARALSEKTRLPLLPLDSYFHQTEFDYINNMDKWLSKVGELTSGETWIIEGNYGSIYEQRLANSDTLIFMDISSWLSIWSVLKRRFQYRNKRRQEMPDDWVEKINPAFFKFVLLFRFKSRKHVIEGIEKYKHENLNVITFKSRKAAYAWLKSI